MGGSSLAPPDSQPFTVANNSQRPLFHISLAYNRTIDLMQSPEWLPARPR